MCIGFVAALYLALVVAKLELHDRQASAFAEIGSDFASAPLAPGYLVHLGSGADGQFYLRLALNPFTEQQDAYGIRLDSPSYRQQRILYPLLAWMLALGNPTLTPIVLIAINFVGLCVLAWIGVRLAEHFGRAPAWGLVFPLYPGLVVSLARDLTEIVATCFLTAALLALINRRLMAASLLLCGAILSRETNTLIAACLLLATIPGVARSLRTPPLPWYVPALPLLVSVMWQAFLGGRWGVAPVMAGGENFAPPLSGITTFAEEIGRPPFSLAAWVRVTELVGATLMALTVLLAFPSTRIGRPVQLAWLGYGLLGLVLSHAVWASDWHILRALTEWHVLGVLILMGSASRFGMLPLLGTVPVWVWTFLAAPPG